MILKFLAAIGFMFLFILAAVLVIGMTQYIIFYYTRKCDKCGKYMSYKGCRKEGDSGYFLFRCKHCGNWEKIPNQEFYRSIDKQYDPDNL